MKTKKFLLLFVTITTLCFSSCNELLPNEKISPTDLWLYKAKIKELSYSGVDYYSLIDLDNDKTLELITNDQTKNIITIYKLINGEIVALGEQAIRKDQLLLDYDSKKLIFKDSQNNQSKATQIEIKKDSLIIENVPMEDKTLYQLPWTSTSTFIQVECHLGKYGNICEAYTDILTLFQNESDSAQISSLFEYMLYDINNDQTIEILVLNTATGNLSIFTYNDNKVIFVGTFSAKYNLFTYNDLLLVATGGTGYLEHNAIILSDKNLIEQQDAPYVIMESNANNSVYTYKNKHISKSEYKDIRDKFIQLELTDINDSSIITRLTKYTDDNNKKKQYANTLITLIERNLDSQFLNINKLRDLSLTELEILIDFYEANDFYYSNIYGYCPNLEDKIYVDYKHPEKFGSNEYFTSYNVNSTYEFEKMFREYYTKELTAEYMNLFSPIIEDNQLKVPQSAFGVGDPMIFYYDFIFEQKSDMEYILRIPLADIDGKKLSTEICLICVRENYKWKFNDYFYTEPASDESQYQLFKTNMSE